MRPVRAETVTSWLGFDSCGARMILGGGIEGGLVKPGNVVTLVSRPYLPFRGERLCVNAEVAGRFLIRQVLVGCENATMGSDPLPADCFATRFDRLATIDDFFQKDGLFTLEVNKNGIEFNGLGAPWDLPICLVGMDIAITIENLGGQPLRFLAGMMGLAGRY